MTTKRLFFTAALTACLLLAVAAMAIPPTYVVYDIGRIDPGDYGSQGIDVSTMLGYAAGSNLGNNNQGWVWTMDTGLVTAAQRRLPPLRQGQRRQLPRRGRRHRRHHLLRQQPAAADLDRRRRGPTAPASR